MGYSGYSYSPTPPPPPPKKNTTRTVLIVVGIVLALCCCGVAVGGFTLFRNVKSAVGPVQDTADNFIGHLEAGETSTAYTSLCPQARSQFTPAQFDAVVASRPKIISHKIVGAFVNTTNGHTSATADAELKYADGSSETHTFDIVKDGTAWMVCGNPY
jgi:hypothetical protein